MKKILFAIAIVLTLGLTTNAQDKNDSFFTDWDNTRTISTNDLALPTWAIGNTNNYDAPLGSGLLVLTALGAGYAVVKKRKK